MNVEDTRLSKDEKKLLSAMVGKSLESYRYTDSGSGAHHAAFEVLEMNVGGEPFTISNALQVVNYFGDREDVCVMEVLAGEAAETAPWFSRQRTETVDVGQRIEDVIVFEDVVTMDGDTESPFEFDSTFAIVFKLERTQIAFMRGHEFGEDIDIERGPGMAKKLTANTTLTEVDDGREFRTERSVVGLSCSKESLDGAEEA